MVVLPPTMQSHAWTLVSLQRLCNTLAPAEACVEVRVLTYDEHKHTVSDVHVFVNVLSTYCGGLQIGTVAVKLTYPGYGRNCTDKYEVMGDFEGAGKEMHRFNRVLSSFMRDRDVSRFCTRRVFSSGWTNKRIFTLFSTLALSFILRNVTYHFFSRNFRFFSIPFQESVQEIVLPCIASNFGAFVISAIANFFAVFCRGVYLLALSRYFFSWKFLAFHLFKKHIHKKAAASTAHWLICEAVNFRFAEVVFQSQELRVLQKPHSIPRRESLVVLT